MDTKTANEKELMLQAYALERLIETLTRLYQEGREDDLYLKERLDQRFLEYKEVQERIKSLD